MRKSAETAFRQEVQFASHLALHALLLPAPAERCVNYAHCINQSVGAYPALQLWVRVLLSPPAREATADDAAAPAAAPAAALGASAPWECWNRLRVLCEAHVAAASAR